MEKSGCPIIFDAPTVIQTLGHMSERECVHSRGYFIRPQIKNICQSSACCFIIVIVVIRKK